MPHAAQAGLILFRVPGERIQRLILEMEIDDGAAADIDYQLGGIAVEHHGAPAFHHGFVCGGKRGQQQKADQARNHEGSLPRPAGAGAIHYNEPVVAY